MKKMLAVMLVALTFFASGCSALGAAASLASDALGSPSASGSPGESSASGTPFPVTVNTPFSFESAMFGQPSASVSPDASPSASGSTQLNVGDVIQTVRDHMPIGLQFVIDQIESLAGTLTGQASAPPSN